MGITVKLDVPVSFNGETFSELKFRKMKAKDLVAGDLAIGETGKALAIFASMAGVAPEIMEELDVDDFEKVGEEVAPLMGKSAAAAMNAVLAKAKTKTEVPGDGSA